jgi:hypothetical protein
MADTVNYYLHYYERGLYRFWDGMGPNEYSTVLLVVAVLGWLAMKSNLKR